jgi:hypothetical protein
MTTIVPRLAMVLNDVPPLRSIKRPGSIRKEVIMRIKFATYGLSITLALLLVGQASAQYGGGGGTSGTPGYSAPSGGYGNGKAIGLGVGAAAAGAGLLYYTLHHRGSVRGCVVATDDKVSLVDKKNRSYLIVPGTVPLKVGERVQLQGRKAKDETGILTLQPTKLVKSLGACSAESKVAAAQTASH